jgi:hypothetical protein
MTQLHRSVRRPFEVEKQLPNVPKGPKVHEIAICVSVFSLEHSNSLEAVDDPCFSKAILTAGTRVANTLIQMICWLGRKE